MNKSDIAGRLAERMGLSTSGAERAVETVLEPITEALCKEEAVRLPGFGTFTTKRAARSGRNLSTGETVAIPSSKAISFKVGKALREAVNGGWKPPPGDYDQNVGCRNHRRTWEMPDVSEWPGGLALVWKAGSVAGAAVRSRVLGHGPLPLRERRIPRIPGVVAAVRDRRHPMGTVGGGGGVAEPGRFDRALHGPERGNTGDAPGAGVGNVRAAKKRTVRPTPVVRRLACGTSTCRSLARHCSK